MLQLLGIFLTYLFGFLFSFLFNTRLRLSTRIGLSFILGIGIQSYLIFLFGIFNVPINLITHLVLLCSGSIMLFILVHKKLFYTFKNIQLTDIKSLSLLDWGLLFFLIAPIIYNFIYALYWPLSDWDSLALYDFRAKYFTNYQELYPKGGIDYFLHYPLLTSLANAWVYILGGDNPRYLYLLFFVSLLLIFYGEVRIKNSRTISLLGLILISSNHYFFEHARIAYTNVPFTVYLIAGIIYLYRWFQNNSISTLILASILIALSSWTRFVEPFYLANGMFVLLASFYKRNLLAFPLFIIPIILSREIWSMYVSSKIASSIFSYTAVHTSQFQSLINFPTFHKLFELINYFYHSIIKPFLQFHLLFTLGVIMELYKRKLNISLLLLVSLNYSVLVAGIYVFSQNYFDWKAVGESATRLSIFLVPLFLYYLYESPIFHNITSFDKHK